MYVWSKDAQARAEREVQECRSVVVASRRVHRRLRFKSGTRLTMSHECPGTEGGRDQQRDIHSGEPRQRLGITAEQYQSDCDQAGICREPEGEKQPPRPPGRIFPLIEGECLAEEIDEPSYPQDAQDYQRQAESGRALTRDEEQAAHEHEVGEVQEDLNGQVAYIEDLRIAKDIQAQLHGHKEQAEQRRRC